VNRVCGAVRDMVSGGVLSDDDDDDDDDAIMASLLGMLHNGSFGLLLDDDSDPWDPPDRWRWY
jgi:hypothetical protein